MHQLPGNHRFPMVKYELIPQQLLHEGLVEKENFFSPTLAKDYWIEKAHDKEYISKLKQLALTKSEIRKTGLWPFLRMRPIDIIARPWRGF